LPVRPAVPADHDAILGVVDRAFSSAERPAQQEIDIVVSTWARAATAHQCELVAVEDDAVVGHVLAARGELGGRPVVGVAPLAVTPDRQGVGIGSALMHALIAHAEDAGLPLLVLLGHPAYYGRFGFEPSAPLGITYRVVGAGHPHFLVRRLAHYDPSYRGDFTYCWEMPLPS
jgi:putative acetyltransferase